MGVQGPRKYVVQILILFNFSSCLFNFKDLYIQVIIIVRVCVCVCCLCCMCTQIKLREQLINLCFIMLYARQMELHIHIQNTIG